MSGNNQIYFREVPVAVTQYTGAAVFVLSMTLLTWGDIVRQEWGFDNVSGGGGLQVIETYWD